MQTFDFLKEYTLENDVVILSPLHTEDIENLKYFALNEPQIWKYSHQPADGLENMQNYIRAAVQARKEGNSYTFVIFDKRTDRYAGSTRLYDYQERNQTVQLGYTWYGEEFQGTGINKNCKHLLLEFAFENLQVERVEFRADAKNERSIAAMKSLGCTVEGILRSNYSIPGGRRDTIIFSILKEEWFGGLNASLLSKIEAEKTTMQS